jgi:hypothetical protein
MSHDHRTTDDLIKIAAAGGGFTTNGGFRTVDDLIRIASMAASSGARVTFTNMNAKTTPDLIRIAGHGMGCVVFD